MIAIQPSSSVYKIVQLQGNNKGEQLNKVSIVDLKRYILSLADNQASVIGQVTKLMQLILVIPATNTTAEQSFNALRRVKSYLTSTMLQKRLNYLMLLHVHTRSD